ncbi:MAG TPA: low temperature requirement protein A [Streptosporangiaceae bacterium]|nr:low temperature requirement protein A [Streptosporangiaceae bacterium]
MAPAEATPDAPLRVSTLELFFDLVFAFTLTQLSALLDGAGLSATSIVQVLLVFGVLWWMYGGYAWLTNTRSPDRAPERLLLLVGMAGFLVVGLAIRNGFGNGRSAASGIFLGVGYLVVVCVHGGLYYRVNRNIVRVLPVNLVSAGLVLVAGLTSGLAAYLLWTAALAIQVLSPLVVRVGGRFEIAPAHFAERHGALVIVALGESVAAVGIGAAAHPLDLQIVLAAVLGLGVSAALWWVYFGGADDERAAGAMAGAPRPRRPALALSAYFYPHIPILLGVVGLAAGVKLTIGHAAQPHPAAQALAIGGGTALFLAGHAAFRRVLHLGASWPRLVTALFALATAALGATVAIEAQLVVLLAGLVVMLAAEQRRAAGASRGDQPSTGVR